MASAGFPIVPVVLCGGEGARLWPVSRKARPKPFMTMADGRTLLRHALERAASLATGGVTVVTGAGLKFEVTEEMAASGSGERGDTLVLEPVARNTAAAIASGALAAADTRGEEAVLVVLPADHLIADEAAFAALARRAAEQARQGGIVVLGIKPDEPSTQYGYIEAGADGSVRFVEKPDAATAETFVSSGRHWWNAGIFVMSVKTALAALERHAPDTLAVCRRALAAAGRETAGGIAQIALDAEAYGRAADISFDYAVMEREPAITALEADIGWSDLGSWPAMGALIAPDAAGNRIEGEALLVDTSNSYVRAEGRLVGMIGLDNVMVVDTADALLVADAAKAGAVRELYGRLKERGHGVALEHRTAYRPWGTYTVLLEGPGFKIKRIVVNAGGRLSLQSHQKRSEHWVVVSGTARITQGEAVAEVGVNQSAYIEVGMKHRLENPGTEPLVLIEVQCGPYLGEDDIERYDDVYGRRDE